MLSVGVEKKNDAGQFLESLQNAIQFTPVVTLA